MGCFSKKEIYKKKIFTFKSINNYNNKTILNISELIKLYLIRTPLNIFVFGTMYRLINKFLLYIIIFNIFYFF